MLHGYGGLFPHQGRDRDALQEPAQAGVAVGGGIALALAMIWSATAPQAAAHCQVPCGIYDDAARITRLHEDATTIAKAVKEINALAAKRDAQALNQAARWIATKEAHASHVIEVVSTYFLTQKVKPAAPESDGYAGYLRKLADHHAVMVAAMKTKQNAEASWVEALHGAIDALAVHYGS